MITRLIVASFILMSLTGLLVRFTLSSAVAETGGTPWAGLAQHGFQQPVDRYCGEWIDLADESWRVPQLARQREEWLDLPDEFEHNLFFSRHGIVLRTPRQLRTTKYNLR